MVVALAQAAGQRQRPARPRPTEATVEGPFYWAGAPDLPLGSDIAAGARGEPALYMGRVTDINGAPLPDALLDVWSGDGAGKYDVQLSAEPKMQARGRFRSDAEGRYWFWSIKPSFYPIPDDGPVGDMMRATARSIYRPGAHPPAGLGAGLRDADDAGLRRRRPVHRRGRGVRHARQPDRRLRAAIRRARPSTAAR